MSNKNNRYYADILPASGGKNHADVTKKLVKRAEKVKLRYIERDVELDDVEKYYYDVGVRKAEDGEIYHVSVSDAQSAVDLIADLLSGQDVRVIVPAMSESNKAKSQANDTERWLEAWFKMTEREEDVCLAHEMAQDIIMRGAAVMRVIMLDERLPLKGNKDRRLMGDFPLIPEVRDYRYCYPVYKRTKLVEVFECYESTIGDIRLDWQQLSLPDKWKERDDDTVQVWEWWSETKKAFWVNGPSYHNDANGAESNIVWLMKPTTHSYGVLPYSIRAMRPQTKKRNDPTKMAKSLLQTWAGVLDAMNLIESAKFTAGMSYINSAWAVYTNRNFDLDLTHGAVNFLYPDKGEKIEPIVKKDIPVDLMQISEDWSNRFQKSSIPSALYGENLGPNMAGYAIALLNESGRRILVPINHALEGCFADACGIALAISEKLLGPTLANLGHKMEIYVTHEDDTKRLVRKGIVLDWKEIDNMYMVEVSLGDPMPQDDERNTNMAIASRQPDANGMPLLSDETIRTDILNISDNERELRRILKERTIIQDLEVQAGQKAISAGIAPDPQAQAQAQGAQPMPDQQQPAPMQQPPPGTDPQIMQAIQMMGQKIMELEQLVMSVAQPQAAPPQPGAPPAPGPGPGPGPGMEGQMPIENMPQEPPLAI